MMNQSAGAQRRPSGSTATAGCCPMLSHPPFFVNPFSARAPLLPPPPAQQCQLGAQSAQLQLTNTAVPQTGHRTNSGASTTTTTTNNNNNTLSNSAGAQQQPQSAAFRQDHSNHSTSVSAHTLPLQHLFAGRHPASNCMALAAALASASFHQQAHQLQQAHQQQLQQQQQHQHHHQSPINHPQQQSTTSAANTTPQQNQVPILNFNSYNAPPFLNLPTPTPITAHLNLSNHQQSSNNSHVTTTTPQTNSTGNQLSHQPPHRPLATNTTLNSAANSQPNNFRTAPQPPIQPQHSAPPSQSINQGSRNLLGDEALNSLFSEHFNEHFQAIVLNQLFANHQFAPPVPPSAPAAPPPPINSARHISPPPSAPAPIITTGQQQQTAAATQQQPPSQLTDSSQGQQQPTNFQPNVQQTTAQSRMGPVPSLDTYSTSATNASATMFPQQHTGPVNRQQQPSEPVPHQTQPQAIPPFYSLQQMEQALALLANPQVTTSLFSQVFNIYLQGGIRTEPHHTHHHHHPPHHYHHHLHGAHHHHHHHHGPNGQNNGQDDTMLTISESKPRGLNRTEIDSLTPYIQMNEKDSRTCVICLSRFELKSKIRPLPCNHAFHAKCVDKWLRANRSCPICRRDALKTYGAKIKRI